MKNKLSIAVSMGLLLVGIGLLVNFSRARGNDPKDLSYWVRAGASKDWSSEAARGEPQAQFYCGLSLIRTNFLTMVQQVPLLSAIPLVGEHFFKKTSYGINSSISQDQLEEAYRWIKKSADQGFAPAKEAERLFIGRTGQPKSGGAKGNQPIRSEVDSTPVAAGSCR